MRGLGTDHVISGSIRGLEKNCTGWRKQIDRQIDRQAETQTDGHGDSMTESAQWGQFSEHLPVNI